MPEKPVLTSVQPFDDEPENEITLTAFRLLTMDLLVLFHVMNEGVINLLGEMVPDGATLIMLTRQNITSKCQNLMPRAPWPSTALSRDRRNQWSSTSVWLAPTSTPLD